MVGDRKEKKNIAQEVLIDKLIQMGPMAFLALSSHTARFAETPTSYIYSTTDDDCEYISY